MSKEIYKGYNITPKYCNPNSDWGQYKGWFYTELPNKSVFEETYQSTINSCKEYIDNYLKLDLSTEDSIITDISSCFTSQGYDGINIDEKKLLRIINILRSK